MTANPHRVRWVIADPDTGAVIAPEFAVAIDLDRLTAEQIDAVPDDLLDQVTTVGTVAECAARIDAEHACGVDMHNVSVQTRSDTELERTLGELVGG